ncbi:MAG: response regulator transcription factor [Alicyclobacillus sp.]|nr:response regulator transcription factor [Alicyclobacillus sp.]
MDRNVCVSTFLLPPLISLGVQTIFEAQDNCSFGTAFATFEAVVETLGHVRSDGIDVLLLGYAEAFDTHPKLLHQLREHNRQLRMVCLLEPWFVEADLVKALRMGADAYLLQSSSPEAVVDAVLTVAGNKAYLEPTVTPAVLAELRKPAYSMAPTDAQVDLTHRERMLLQLAADGLNSARIADVLNISEKTLRHAWSNLFHKTGLTDRTQAVLWAIRTGHAELR